MDPVQILLVLCLGAIAVILIAIAAPILVALLVGIGAFISIPFLWIADVVARKWRRYGLWRDDKRAAKLGFDRAYAYRIAKHRAEAEGITVEEYAERARKYREERGY